MYSSVEVRSPKPSVDEGSVVFPNPSVVQALDMWVMCSVMHSSTSAYSSPSSCCLTSCTLISLGLLCRTHLITVSNFSLFFCIMLTFSFTSDHQNITVHAEVHADMEAPVKEVHAEPVAPVQQLDTHSNS